MSRIEFSEAWVCVWRLIRLGRKRVYGYTLVLMIITSLASGLSFGSSAKGVMSTLCFFRFWLGFGIGGDYPLSATIMSEYANQKTRGAFIAAVFAMQGVGIVAGATVSIIVASIFRRSYPSPSFEVDPLGSQPSQADYVWRIIFMFGAAPAALTFYYRMQMPELRGTLRLLSRTIDVLLRTWGVCSKSSSLLLSKPLSTTTEVAIPIDHFRIVNLMLAFITVL